MNELFFEVDEACDARMFPSCKPGSQDALVNQV